MHKSDCQLENTPTSALGFEPRVLEFQVLSFSATDLPHVRACASTSSLSAAAAVATFYSSAGASASSVVTWMFSASVATSDTISMLAMSKPISLSAVMRSRWLRNSFCLAGR